MNIKQKRGVVLEINDSEMVLLTPEGEFVRRPALKNTVELGQEIFYTENIEPLAPSKQKFLTSWRRSGLAVAAVLLLLLLPPAILNYLPLSAETIAYVTIDVNPSVELGIDNKNSIASVEGLNDDGKYLLKSLDLLGKKSEVGTELITRKMIELGYMKSDQIVELVITVRPVKTGNQAALLELEKSLKSTAKTALAQDDIKYALIQTALIDDELMLSAQTAQVSPGKYIYMLKTNQPDDSFAWVNKMESDVNADEKKNVDYDETETKPDELEEVIPEDVNEAPKPSESNDGHIEVADASTPDKTGKKADGAGKTSNDIDALWDEQNMELDEQTVIAMLKEQFDAGNLEKLLEMAALHENGEEFLKEIMNAKIDLEENEELSEAELEAELETELETELEVDVLDNSNDNE